MFHTERSGDPLQYYHFFKKENQKYIKCQITIYKQHKFIQKETPVFSNLQEKGQIHCYTTASVS